MYEQILEQQYQLHEYGKLDLFEQNNMTAEDRNWWLRRVEREHKERNEKENSHAGSIPRPSMPSVSTPSIPSINVPRL